MRKKGYVKGLFGWVIARAVEKPGFSGVRSSRW